MNAHKGKLQYTIDLILAVFFIALIYFFCIATTATEAVDIYQAGTRLSKLQTYLPEDYDAWDLFAARIKSVDDYIGENLYGSEELGYLNSSFQYALGKQMVNTGSSQMLTLTSGNLYDLQAYVPMEGAVQKIAAMKDSLPSELPFLFVYEQPTLYENDLIPEGYEVLDHSTEMAEEIVSGIKACGIDILDSRTELTGHSMEALTYRTDQHWTTYAGLEMSRSVAERISEMTGVALDTARLEPSAFDTETFEKLFLGKYGQRIGPGNIEPDDVTVFYPKAATSIRRRSLNYGETTDISGDFKTSVIRWDKLEPLAGKTWTKKAYGDYGLVDTYDIFSNADGADLSILLLKASYASPIGAFLSLVAENVTSVDLRSSNKTLVEWAEECKPDIVIVAYSLQMMRDDNYEFQ